MPKPYIWLIDSTARLFKALPNSKKIHPVDSIGTNLDEFRRVCATKHGAWVLACDHNIYVYVQPSDLPIRVQETTYENEVYVCVKLLFNNKSHLFTVKSDRYHWSDVTGKISLPKDNFRLPSENWSWEGDWTIDENFYGQITDRGGWQYALDFPAKWTAEKHWKSFVRRRKWIRFRRYNAIDKWAKLPSLRNEEIREPFTDLAAGGWAISGRKEDELSVWAVTLNGEVYVREGVRYKCPEGEAWKLIPVSREVCSISVSSTGNVWAVTCDGCAFVRKNISRNNLYGDSWDEVEYPNINNRLSIVAVGVNAVWAVSRQGKVFFRKDVTSYQVAGTDWIEMVGEMSFIGLGVQDQVYAIGLTDSLLYYRTGVTKNDLCGKTWQPLYFVDSNVSLSCSDSDSSSQMSLSLYSVIEKQFIDSTDSEGAPISMLSSSLQSYQMSDFVDGQSSFKTQKSDITKCSDSIEKQSLPEKLQSGLVETKSTGDSNKNIQSENSEGIHHPEEGPKNSGKARTEMEGTTSIENENLCTGSHDTARECSVNVKTPNLIEDQFSSDKCDKQLSKDDLSFVNSVGSSDNTSLPNLQENYFSAQRAVNTDALPPVQPKTKSNIETSIKDDSDSDSEKIFNFVTDLMDSDDGETVDTVCRNQNDVVINKNSSDSTLDDLKTPVEQRSRKLENSNNTLESSSANQIPSLSGYVEKQSKDYKNELDYCQTSITQTTPLPSDVEELPVDSELLSSMTFSLQDSLRRTDSQATIEMFEDYGEIIDNKWYWVGAEFCLLENPDKCPWFTIPKEVMQTKKCNINMVLRLEIMKRLITRNKHEVDNFGDFQQAVDKQTWLKKASMKFCLNEKSNQWTKCKIEFEQSTSNKLDSKFTIQYLFGKKQVLMQFPVKDILCIWRTRNVNQQWTIAMHTIRTIKHLVPVMFSASDEQEMLDWMNALHFTIVPTQILRSPVKKGSFWGTTFFHDVFVCQAEKTRKITDMHHMQIGGHMKMVETCPIGVTWGLGNDGTPYVYTGACGGGIFKGLSDAPQGIYEQTDKSTVVVFKREKWYPVTGYVGIDFIELRLYYGKEVLLTHNSYDDVKLPSGQCQWTSDWTIDYSPPGGADSSGWQYAPDFNRTFHPQKGFSDYVRRMKLCRTFQICTSGPWKGFFSVPLIDLSIHSNPNQKVVHVWAVSSEGAVLCRTGVTLSNLQGDTWLHVNTDQPICSISVGEKNRVWAIAKDGSAWFRNGVDEENLAGKLWLQIIPPPQTDALLKQVSVGKTSVWATDDKGCLWYRENITPTYPEGTRWAYVEENVNTVSVGPMDQVWITAKAEFGKTKSPRGFIYRRLGIKDETMTGTSWEPVMGGGWNHVSIRGKIN